VQEKRDMRRGPQLKWRNHCHKYFIFRL